MTTLYGKLVARVAWHYERSTQALNTNTALINAFDDVIRPLNLQPEVTPLDGGRVALTAVCPRGQDHMPVIPALQELGFRVGEPVKETLQLNDGYVIWTAQVRNPSMEFTLFFYIPQDVC